MAGALRDVLRHPVLAACRRCVKHGQRQQRFITTESSKRPSTLGELGTQMTEKDSARTFSPRSNPFDEIQRPDMRPVRPHHLHIFSTRHNTHITLTNEDRNPMISKSAGNIGFKKSARGTYDAAYQLSAYVLGQIYENGLLQKIKSLEVIMRGFGIGREAVQKALMGPEGMKLRPYITLVTDSTRLKFGGTRSRKPRRLG